MSSPVRLPAVAYYTAATPKLLGHGHTHARDGLCVFALLVHETLEHSSFDEVVVSTLPRRVSHPLRLDLPTRTERLGVPVTIVRATQSQPAWEA